MQEPAATDRTAFQRDRDRIVHCSSFRRLVYKTQVFLNHEGDLFRTRLTHSLEVAQLARSMARSLQLNEDLVEGIALAHDLGHTPFGHAGQDALNACMDTHGGFEHNLQSLRVVDSLEQRYARFDGLNLSFELREGILKHCSISNAHMLEEQEPRYADGAGGVGCRFIERRQPSLEAQLCNIADEIAYNAHDVDDGVRAGLVSVHQLAEVALFEISREKVLHEHPTLHQSGSSRRLLYETIRRMLSDQVHDLIAASREALEQAAPHSVQAVREQAPLIAFTDSMRQQSQALKQFLFHNLYRHPQVEQQMAHARRIVEDLFKFYCADATQMAVGADGGENAMARGQQVKSGPRCVADYIAGMTDRFAVREHFRLTGQTVFG